MKQKIMLEIESTEFQKALEQEIEAYTKSFLRSGVDKTISDTVDETLKNKITPSKIESIIKSKVDNELYRSWTNITIKTSAEQYMKSIVDALIVEKTSNILWQSIKDEVKAYVKSEAKAYAQEYVISMVEKTIKEVAKEQIENIIKEILASKLLK